MKSIDWVQLRRDLDEYRASITDAWCAAIRGIVPSLDRDHTHQLLDELTSQTLAILGAKTFDARKAREVGVKLAQVHAPRPEILSATQSVLGNQLAIAISPQQFQKRRSFLFAFLGELGAGFFDEARAIILLEQAQISAAYFAECRNAELELDEYRQRLEHMVQERTSDLMNAIMHLEQEITDRKRVTEALQYRNRELALINRSSRAFGSTLDLDEVLLAVLEEVRRLLDVVAVSIWLIDQDTGDLVCRQATGPQSEIVQGWRLPPGEGIAGWVVEHGDSLIIPDITKDKRHFKAVDQTTGLPLRSILTTPLRTKEGVIGVIQAMDVAVDFFRQTDLMLLESLAAPATIAIDNARLVEMLRHKTNELKIRNDELKAFSYTVAHDLKNPLTYVVGFAETLRDSYRTLDDEDVDRYLSHIAKSGRKMKNIIDALLLLAGVREMKVDPKPLDMAHILDDVLHRMSYMIEENDAEIILPEQWPTTLGYGPWIEEVWVNYISNGIKYGGDPPRLRLGAEAGGDEDEEPIYFWIQDNGQGLTPEEQERLFTPFTQLKQIQATGYGLGLSIVRRIVEKLGGRVWVESEVGAGSTFYFSLPAAPAHLSDEMNEKG